MKDARNFGTSHPSGWFYWVDTRPPPSGWFHVVYNYIGQEDGGGVRVYHDGKLVGSSLEKNEWNYGIVEGDGRIAIGRCYIDSNWMSGSHEVDELFLFNKALTDAEIERLNLS